TYQYQSTQTNQWGTEIRIRNLDTLRIGQAIRFEVMDRQSNIGNMPIQAGSFVLSGHGKAKAYLDSTAAIGDTLEVTLGTTPESGSLFSLVGGGPRLVTNGVIPASFVGMEGFDVSFTDSKHPRSAVGFTQDSTIVYLVAVDGRQPLLSDGMTLSELANLMLSLGCYQAVNLDGGGSTAMVIRDSIVNSPSDPTERSVANALIAYHQAPSSELAHHLLLQAESMVLDTSKRLFISCKVIDHYGYPLPVKSSEIQWRTTGVSGQVDSLGYFTPLSTGDGYIIAHYQGIEDSIPISIESNPVPFWMKSATGIGTQGIPSWFSREDHTERGLAYDSLTHRLMVVSRHSDPAIYILDSNSGDSLGKLDMTGIKGGTLPVNDVEASADSVIIAANMTRNAKNVPFKVYQWDRYTDAPRLIIEYADTNYALGDRINLIGSISRNSAKLYAAAYNSNAVLIWSMNDGAFIPSPQRIHIQGIKKLGNSVSVYPDPNDPSRFYINSDSMTLRHYDSQGALLDSLPDDLIGKANNSFKIIKIENSLLALVFEYGPGKETACLIDITGGLHNATLIHRFSSLGLNDNTVAGGDVAYGILSPNQIAVFILSSNNGLAAFPLNLNLSVSIGDPNQIESKPPFCLSPNYPNPFNASTTISYQLDSPQHVRLSIYNLLGEKVSELVNHNQPTGLYRFQWPERSQSSGIYFCSLEILDDRLKPCFQQTRRMLLIK
ncbi:MAG: phosphodiester glycosidase family protein, partial [Candidatus Delongbacteria bacterium]|nr:phosphodiester glycosidase family protein [Candidatus Delongbacteria bacterium]